MERDPVSSRLSSVIKGQQEAKHDTHQRVTSPTLSLTISSAIETALITIPVVYIAQE